jgi:hypothetical protein
VTFEHLGPDLSSEVEWEKTDAPLEGELADLLRAGQWDINKMAHYMPIYEQVFDRYCHRWPDDPPRLLEIGVNLGGSLELWRNYFHHPDAVVVGIDYNEKCRQLERPERNIHVRIGKQQDRDFLQSVVDEFGPFDVIIDDGSHIPSFTLKSFQFLFVHGLRDPGSYIVEDLHSCYHTTNAPPFPDDPSYTGADDGSPQFIEYVKRLMDAMHAHYLQTPNGDAMDKWEPPNLVYQDSFQVPLATTIIESIQLFSDLVVIRRGKPQLPRMIRRWSKERMDMIINPEDADDFLNRRHPFLGEADRTRQDWISE